MALLATASPSASRAQEEPDLSPQQKSAVALFAIDEAIHDPEVDVDYYLPQFLQFASPENLDAYLQLLCTEGDVERAEFVAETAELLAEYGPLAAVAAREALAATGNSYAAAANGSQRPSWKDRLLGILNKVVAGGEIVIGGAIIGLGAVALYVTMGDDVTGVGVLDDWVIPLELYMIGFGFLIFHNGIQRW